MGLTSDQNGAIISSLGFLPKGSPKDMPSQFEGDVSPLLQPDDLYGKPSTIQQHIFMRTAHHHTLSILTNQSRDTTLSSSDYARCCLTFHAPVGTELIDCDYETLEFEKMYNLNKFIHGFYQFTYQQNFLLFN